MPFNYELHDSSGRTIKKSKNFKTQKQAKVEGHKALYKSKSATDSAVGKSSPKKRRTFF